MAKEEPIPVPERTVVWTPVAEKRHQSPPELTVDRGTVGGEVPEDAAHDRWSGSHRGSVPLAANVGLMSLCAFVINANEDFGKNARQQGLQPTQEQQRGQQ